MPSNINLVLHAAVLAICPISGVRIPDAADAGTWNFWPTAAATPSQIISGFSALATCAASLSVAFVTPAQTVPLS